MNYDQYGQCWTTPDELCDLIYQEPDLSINKFLVKSGGERGSIEARSEEHTSELQSH